MTYRISVLISTYNNRRFVSKKIKEVLAQTLFEHSEFIFIETASPEKERELIQPLCEQYPNCRLITLGERKTLYQAWNMGWSAATAPLICYSNMDDAMHPLLLADVVRKMGSRRLDACTTLIVKQTQSEIKDGDWSIKTLKGLPLSLRPGPFTAWRADLQKTIGMFDPQLIVTGDLEFWARMLAARLKIGFIPKVLYLYAKEPQQQLSKSVHGREIRKQEESLLASKPYPVKWSYVLRWQVFFLRYLWRLYPGLFLTEKTF